MLQVVRKMLGVERMYEGPEGVNKVLDGVRKEFSNRC